MTRCIVILAFFVACAEAVASAEVASFRLNPSGQVEAVVSGLTGFCGQTNVHPATSIDIGTTIISINSIVGGSVGGCPEPLPPPMPYEVVTVLGVLPPQTFTVVWTSMDPAGPRSTVLTATLVVGALLPSNVASIPTLSSYALAALISPLILSGACLTQRSTGRADTWFQLGEHRRGPPVSLIR
jgi:hypothetical protein